jgi:glycosyltransferase involved in cell wall biosynthesis
MATDICGAAAIWALPLPVKAPILAGLRFMPAVSVIMLAWNNGPLLTAAASSILDQTFRDLELIVVDNASIDGSIEQLQQARPDSRLKIIRHTTNLGVAETYMAVLPGCSSPWIAILDADDLAHPMRLELQLKAAEADPTLDVIATGVEAIDVNGNSLGPFPSFYTPEDIRLYAPFGMPVAHPSLMGRAEIFRNVGYRAPIALGPDYDFVVRALEAGAKFGSVSLPLLRYRRHSQSATVARAAEFEAGTCALRLCTARRRAGRPEQLEETLATVRELNANRTPLPEVYRHFARQCRREGFPLIAALHAALAVRESSSPFVAARFFYYVAAAIRADRGSFTTALGAAAKGPFWALLKRAGFPAFPRY